MRKARDTRDSSAREAATAIASKLVPMIIKVPAKAGPEGKLFGSVTSGDIVAAVLDETGIELERRQLEVDTIKTLGQHTVTASLHSDVSFPIRLDVVAADRLTAPSVHDRSTQVRVHSHRRLPTGGQQTRPRVVPLPPHSAALREWCPHGWLRRLPRRPIRADGSSATIGGEDPAAQPAGRGVGPRRAAAVARCDRRRR